MNLTVKLADLKSEAGRIAASAGGRSFTEAEATRLEALQAEGETLKAAIARDRKAREMVAAMTGDKSEPDRDDRDDRDRSPGGAPFARAVVAEVGRKAVTIGGSGGVSVPADQGLVPLGRASEFIYPALRSMPMDSGDSFSYLRQTARTVNAAFVAVGQLKPESVYGFTRIESQVGTLAHLVKAVPLQWMADNRLLEQFLGEEMGWGLASKLDAALLTGYLTEGGDTVDGLLTASGVQAQAFDTDSITTVRLAISVLQAAGYKPDRVVVNPVVAETWDLLQDSTGRYLGSGPFGPGVAQTAWRLPVSTSLAVPAGTGIVGSFSDGSIALAQRENTVLRWQQVGEDFQRNSSSLLAEQRVGVALLRPGAFCVADLAA